VHACEGAIRVIQRYFECLAKHALCFVPPYLVPPFLVPAPSRRFCPIPKGATLDFLRKSALEYTVPLERSQLETFDPPDLPLLQIGTGLRDSISSSTSPGRLLSAPRLVIYSTTSSNLEQSACRSPGLGVYWLWTYTIRSGNSSGSTCIPFHPTSIHSKINDRPFFRRPRNQRSFLSS
jgi:hypothetical protein